MVKFCANTGSQRAYSRMHSFMGRDSSVSKVPGCTLNRLDSIPMLANSEFHRVGNWDTFSGDKLPQHEVCHSPSSIMLRHSSREALLSRLIPDAWSGRGMHFSQRDRQCRPVCDPTASTILWIPLFKRLCLTAWVTWLRTMGYLWKCLMKCDKSIVHSSLYCIPQLLSFVINTTCICASQQD
jgi:hypothetical protein